MAGSNNDSARTSRQVGGGGRRQNFGEGVMMDIPPFYAMFVPLSIPRAKSQDECHPNSMTFVTLLREQGRHATGLTASVLSPAANSCFLWQTPFSCQVTNVTSLGDICHYTLEAIQCRIRTVQERDKMRNYFRVQEPGLSIEEMRNFVSADGGDGYSEYGGVCACDSVADLKRNTAMDAANEDDEVVVFAGRELCEIYDGYRVEPVAEVKRVTVRYFLDHLEEMTEFEKW